MKTSQNSWLQVSNRRDKTSAQPNVTTTSEISGIERDAEFFHRRNGIQDTGQDSEAICFGPATQEARSRGGICLKF